MSPVSLALFLVLIGAVAAVLLAGVRHAASKAAGPAVIGLALWLAGTAALAASGVLSRFDRVPPPALFALVGFAGASVALAFSPFGKKLALGVPLWALVGFQAFRFPLEVLLHRLYGEGVLPVQMTYAGWNYDIATGVLALVLGAWLWRGTPPRWVVTGWNALGIALLAVVVATAVLSLPTPFQRFTAPPTTAAVLTAPLIWLPAVLVQAALVGHLLVWRRLRGGVGVERQGGEERRRTR